MVGKEGEREGGIRFPRVGESCREFDEGILLVKRADGNIPVIMNMGGLVKVKGGD